MLSDLNALAPSVVAVGVTYVIHSTVLLAGVWLLVRFIRTPSSKSRLWKWALVAPCLTTVVQLSFATGFEFTMSDRTDEPAAVELLSRLPEPEAQTKALTGRASDAPLVFSPIENTETGHLHTQPTVPAMATAIGSQTHVAPEVQTQELVSGSSWLLIAVSCVTGILLVRSACLALRLRVWLRRTTKRANGELERTVQSFASDLGIRRTVHLVTGDVVEPCSLGIFRWLIVLPTECESRLTQGELNALIGHELAHLANRDPVWLWTGRLIGDLFWFQPLNRVASKQIRKLSEFLSDEWATSRSVSPVDLASCLTVVAEWTSGSRSPQFVSSATGHPSTLVERVERLVAEKSVSGRRTNRKAIVGVWIAACTVGLIAILPRATWSTTRQPSTPVDTDAASVPGFIVDSGEPESGSLEQQLDSVATDLDHVRQLLADESDSDLQALGESLGERLIELRNTVSHRAPVQPASQGE